MDGIALLTKLTKAYRTLPGSLDSCSKEKFRDKFQTLFSSPEARQARCVVYVWVTQKPIPRLKEESNIVYIGQTKETLSKRQYGEAKTEVSDYNWKRWQFILSNYGCVTVMYVPAAEIGRMPEQAEKELLKRYFEEHLEYPPFNRQSEGSCLRG